MGQAQSKEDWGRDVNYLLGKLGETERDAVREELLTDAAAFAKLREAENDLFDAYARGTLNGEQRKAFEETLLQQADAAARLRASRALMAPVAAQRHFRWWYVLAALAAAVSAFLLRDMPHRSERAPAAPMVAVAAAQSFRLPSVTRGSTPMDLAVSPATTALEFSAEVPAGPRTEQYPVTVERAAGGIVWSGVAPVAAGELRWRLPVLAAGAYAIRVGSASEPLAFYEIRVVR